MIGLCGEVDVCLYRNDHKLKFRAIIAQNLYCPVIGGTTFTKDNIIKQDFIHNQISLLGNKCTVPATHREALLPITQRVSTSLNTIHTNKSTHQQHNAVKLLRNTNNLLVSIKSRKIILPGDQLTIKTDLSDQHMVVEAMKQSWPSLTLATIKNNILKLTNNTNKSVLLDGKNTLYICVTLTTNSSILDTPSGGDFFQQYTPKSVQTPLETETIKLIKFGKLNRS